MDIEKLTAACGLACFECNWYKDNITDELAAATAQNMGITVEAAKCQGCRSEEGCIFESTAPGGKGCLTKNCAAEKDIHNCSECQDFPCDYLMPLVDRASQLPHNLKLYNLSRIKAIGLEAWSEEAGTIFKTYFDGNFVYGQSPSLSEDK